MKMHVHHLTAAVLAAALIPAFAADDAATPAEAQERLTAIVALVKAKGVQGAADEIMNASDPIKCKYKDMTCILMSDSALFLANTSRAALIGTTLPLDLKDPDGNPIVAAQVGGLKEGKTKWEAKFKFVRPGSKTIQPRWSFCERAADNVAACVVVAVPS
jgi:hypothetical protein